MTPAELVANADAVILDFDGPMCDVFALLPAHRVARELAIFTEEVWMQHGSSIKDVLPDTDDPFEVLAAAMVDSTVKAGHVSLRLRELEVEAVEGAPPTDGLVDFLSRLTKSGQAIAIASNNSTGAIKHWLGLQHLEALFSHVAARQVRSDRLKPNPYVLSEACSALQTQVQGCVFIGDTLSDLEAAKQISMPFIGFANKPHKSAMFRRAGGEHVIASYAELD